MKNKISIFENKKGGTDNPLFQLRATDFGIICKSRESESIYWYDNMGSVGKFYSLRGLSFDNSREKENLLNQLLLSSNSSNINELESVLVDLMQILPKGEYSCTYYEPENKYQEKGFNHYNIVFPLYDKSITNEKDTKEKFASMFVETVKERGNYLPLRYLNNLAINFYDGCERYILATKHEDSLNSDRIQFYKSEIENGKTPPLIIFTGMEEGGITNSFIIDGHHRAMAYVDLEKNPPLIELIGTITNSNSVIEDLKQTSSILYPEQMEYLIRANYQFEEPIKEICADPDLAKFCLNGMVKRYYPNGQLWMEGNYIEAKPHGEFVEYFPDGTLKKRVRYEMGKWEVTYEEYFHNGKLLMKGDDNGIIEQYDIFGRRVT